MKKSRSPKEPVKASVTFLCLACNESMDNLEAFKSHLKDKHQIVEFKGTRKMLMHLDCEDSYHSEFELEIGGLKFRQATSNPRHKNDLMRFA